MTRALLVVDVQNDFTEGGALGVTGGGAVAAGITEFLRATPGRYDLVLASRDWHDSANDNGGHFAVGADPDFVTTWPVHCVAGTPGAEYHPALDASLIDVHVRKGMGVPAYSLFEGVATPADADADGDDGDVVSVLLAAGVDEIDVVGIATDYCVRASALDAVDAVPGAHVRVLSDLVAGVAGESSADALVKLAAAGIEVSPSAEV